MTTIDFTASAELFPARSWKAKAHGIRYKRFDDAAEAVRYAIEDLPPECLLGTYLEVEEARFDSRGIRRLYEREDFPHKSAPKAKRAKRTKAA
ncbi:hypothetical protein AUC71_03860 [Methyloceanibacter marginalis]|jgi:hypothetical protein|uniref:Uncharacterized protein n=1 Tax=Methyloceanibacter marginalis TaxID=1774971 RepID=A0A1E3VZ02_9HYPH|nr:hypothetical protein [Methyloceanibacter marginalis]ODR98733.1 hypothetical protein AUC71_03860 [Methyloceanibacter marginalis]